MQLFLLFKGPLIIKNIILFVIITVVFYIEGMGLLTLGPIESGEYSENKKVICCLVLV